LPDSGGLSGSGFRPDPFGLPGPGFLPGFLSGSFFISSDSLFISISDKGGDDKDGDDGALLMFVVVVVVGEVVIIGVCVDIVGEDGNEAEFGRGVGRAELGSTEFTNAACASLISFLSRILRRTVGKISKSKSICSTYYSLNRSCSRLIRHAEQNQVPAEKVSYTSSNASSIILLCVVHLSVL